MNKLHVFLAFVAGGVCGVLGTKAYFEALYRRQYEEDLESVKKVWTYKKPVEDEVKEDNEPVLDKEPRENEMYQYAKILQKKGYTNYSDTPVDTSEIGLDSLNHFGEYEEDVLYVRNERLRTDYEVLMDPRTYPQVLEERPYLSREDE